MADLFDTLTLSRDGQVSAASLEFTAIDFKTSGLYPGHIVELAAVRVRADGTVLRELSTLVRPSGEVDAGHIRMHHLTPDQIAAAPPLDEILGHFVELCRNSVIVAHNLPFEGRFLTEELARLGVRMPQLPGICMLASAKQALRLPNYRLATVAGALGIADFPAHLALADARVCARIAATLVTTHGFGLTSQPRFPKLPRLRDTGRPLPRPEAAPSGSTSWMAGLVDRMPAAGVGALEDAYLEMLSDALSDRKISEQESHALALLAAKAGMSKDDVRRVHKGFVMALRAVAENDGIVTVDEESDVRRVADALGVPEVAHDLRATNAPARPASTRVLVLGHTAYADELRAAVLSSGIQLAKKLTASVTHLVVDHTVPANEPRLARARELGIPSLDIESAQVALGFVEPPDVVPFDEPTEVFRPVAPVPPPAPLVPAARDARFWVSHGLMGVGLFLMFIAVIAQFGGSGFGAALFMAILGLGSLLGGWYASHDPAATMSSRH
ncbi:exonuclease domain-containing protein [Amycolatopsis sp.]|uniref:exonuclease domain-containing protein n=1 Tax=Amycolatopsis sp. TaxID=37632 RepID=UPI002E0C8C45|nr:exonuclease domain-containing protein [Amycolatopsis sp.]